jgi:hypothetical protein
MLWLTAIPPNFFVHEIRLRTESKLENILQVARNKLLNQPGMERRGRGGIKDS